MNFASDFRPDSAKAGAFEIYQCSVNCVLRDLSRAEWGVNDAAYDYLRLAETRGLGVFERREPWSSSYQKINYLRVELP